MRKNQVQVASTRKMTTGSGTGPTEARSIPRKPGVNRPGATLPSRRIIPDDTDCPDTGTSFSPMITNMVPSVASRSGILSTTMRKALSPPTSAPATRTTSTAMPPTWA